MAVVAGLYLDYWLVCFVNEL